MNARATGDIVIVLVLEAVALVATVVWLVGQVREALHLRRICRASPHEPVRAAKPVASVRLVWSSNKRMGSGGKGL
jgi:hypothetical protein